MPKEVRDFLGLEEGTHVEWTMDDNGKAAVKPGKLRAVAGMLGKPPNGRHATIKDMNDAIGERCERTIRR